MASVSDQKQPQRKRRRSLTPPRNLDQPQPRRRKSMTPPLTLVSDLRIVVLGKISSEISRVGNFILGRAAFDTEAPPPTVEQHSERSRGRVETRYITVINTPHLFDPHLSVEELNQRVKESASLCDPGPHAFLLVLQSNNFTKQDRDKIKYALFSYSQYSLNYTIVIITDHTYSQSQKNECLQQLIKECHSQFEENPPFDQRRVLLLFEKIEKIIMNNSGHLTCEIKEPLSVKFRTGKSFFKSFRGRAHSAGTKKTDCDRSGRRTSVSDLRIIVLGKISSEISRVGNFILGRAAFDTEAPPPSVEHHSERSRGRVERRYITVINTPHLFDPQLSVEELNQRLRESISLCDPGPHVIVLVLHPNDFTDTDRMRLDVIFSLLCEEPHKHTLVLTTHNLQSDTNKDPTEESVSQIITDCSNRHFQFSSESSCSSLVEMMEKMFEDNGGSYLKWEDCHDTTEQLHEEPTKQKESEIKVKEKKSTNDGKGLTGSMMQRLPFGDKSSDVSERLNLVVCGSDAALKSSISDIILDERRVSPESSSECVRRDGEVCGYQITLVEIPALYNTQLSEEEVMQETLRCVSLCDPGVHAFLLILPVRPLTDEDKGEIEKIQRYFESKVMENMIVVFTAEKTDLRTVSDFIKSNPDMKNIVTTCKDRYIVMKRDFRQVENLLTYIKEQNFIPYSLQMYVNIREERIRCELNEKIQEMEKTVRDLKNEIIQTKGGDDEDLKSLRIVLIGKTGNGKSATGNTILGQDEFETESSTDSVTTVCQKAVAEVLGKSVTVVDTPGLFDTTLTNKLVQQEIVKCISLLAPGPHAFIIVLSVGRQTEEELKTLDLITKMFGPKAAMFSIVLFTRGDDLKKEDTIQKYVERSKSAPLKKLIRDCGDRLLVFNNRTKDQSQVSDLLQMIEKVIKSNNSHYFTNSMFEEAEMSIEKKVEEILKERQQEIEAEKMKLESKFNTEIEKLKKIQEDEKLKADSQKQQIEKTFREKEEALKKEFKKKEKAERKKWEQEDIVRSEEMKKQMDTWKQKIEGLKRDNKKQRAEFEQQLKDRDEEDKKKEDQNKRDRENLENELKRVMEELKKRQKEDLQRRDEQESKRRKEEEKERKSWERRIKEAEHERKEIQEDLKCKQREWEEENKRQMKKREEEDSERKLKHEEELKAKQEEQDQMRKKFEKEREKERLRREEEKRQWKEEERKEREQKEREYEEKRQAMEAQMKKQYEKLEQTRKKEWEKRKHKDDKRIEEERQRLQKLRDEMEKEQQEENKKREREDKERRKREEKMKKNFHQGMKEMKIKYESEAREQAEKFNDFNEQKLKEFQELTEKHQKKYEILERLFKLTDGQKSDQIKELQKERDELKDKEKELDELKDKVKECDELKDKVKELDELKDKVKELDELKDKQRELEIKKLLEELANELKSKSTCVIQ